MSIREKLEAAWSATYDGSFDPVTGAWAMTDSDVHDHFTRLLDAEAWLEAAMMLVPEGWNVDMGFRPARNLCWAEMARSEHDPLLVGKYSGRAPTPAEALLAAIEKARTV